MLERTCRGQVGDLLSHIQVVFIRYDDGCDLLFPYDPLRDVKDSVLFDDFLQSLDRMIKVRGLPDASRGDQYLQS